MSEPDRRRRAVALRYDTSAPGAPRVVAVGAGEIARRILELAGEAGVPVHEDPALVEALGRLELEQEIPPELFVASPRCWSGPTAWSAAAERRPLRRDGRPPLPSP